jgi:predicted phosphodiesterase
VTVAALYDIHGNLPALEAVLAEVEAAAPDLVMVGGDVIAGPLPEVEDPIARLDAWCAQRITREQRDLVASFEPVVRVDSTLFCHGSPRSDTEIITALSPEERLAPMLEDVAEQVVVCGHTHHQFDRRVLGRRLLNAGSVGMPYEDEAAAYVRYERGYPLTGGF